MSDELQELKDKVDLILDILTSRQAPIDALGEVLIEADFVTKVKGLNKSTISQNKKLDKFQGIGQRKILMRIESIPVVKVRKKTKKQVR